MLRSIPQIGDIAVFSRVRTIVRTRVRVRSAQTSCSRSQKLYRWTCPNQNEYSYKRIAAGILKLAAMFENRSNPSPRNYTIKDRYLSDIRFEISALAS